MGAEWVPVRRAKPPVRYLLGESQIRLARETFLTQLLRIRQAQQQRPAVNSLAVIEQLIDALVAAPGAVDQHVFQFHQPCLALQREP